MRVAWVTHHVERNLEAQWALPDGVGGAEMCDAAMIEHRPDGVDVTVIQPDAWQQALDYDRIVVTGTDLLTDEAMLALAEPNPIVWVHHQQAPNPARAALFAAAAPFVTMSDLHGTVERAWSGVDSLVNHGWIDPDDVAPAEKTHDTLWAARSHPQKGLMGARMWAQSHGRTLTELTNVPRGTVLDAMAHHRTFVFLPKGLDACPRTLIEAELAGCEIVTNAQAGRREAGDIRQVLADQVTRFWGWL